MGTQEPEGAKTRRGSRHSYQKRRIHMDLRATGTQDETGVRPRLPKEQNPRGNHREPRGTHREPRQGGLGWPRLPKEEIPRGSQ